VNTCFASHELSQQATAFYSDNNFQKTLELLLQINEHERSAQDWLLLGNLLDEKGERQNAEFMYQKAIFADKKYYKAYYNLANHYLADEKYSFAIENYKLAIKYNKDNPYVYYNLACAYIKQAELKKAKSELIKAVTLNSNIPEIHYNLAYVYKNLGKDKIAKDYLDNYNKLTNQF
jgi:tetratricopeptide (TPR) repeat protein